MIYKMMISSYLQCDTNKNYVGNRTISDKRNVTPAEWKEIESSNETQQPIADLL